MANDLIKIDRTDTAAIFSSDLKNAIELIRSARSSLERVRGYAVHSAADPDYSALETRFGVPTGTGSALFTLLDGSLQAMDGTSSGYIDELLSRVG